MKRIYSLLLVSLFFCAGLHAQNKAVTLLHSGADLLDRILRQRRDSLYIELPQQRWSVMARSNFDQVSLTMSNEQANDIYILGLEPTVTTGLNTAVGLRAGYRTLFAGYQMKFGGSGGGDFTFGSNGNRFGLNMRIRNMQTSSPSTHVYIKTGPKGLPSADYDTVQALTLESPIRIRSMLIDGYYVFNDRHYSNGATNALAFIQRKSAGGFLVGASWLRSSADYADIGNWSYIHLVSSIGRIKLEQINLCAGYGYNWVPQRDWVVNLTVMPQLTVYNRLELDYYAATVDYGESGFEYEVKDMWLDKTVSEKSSMKLTWTGRMAVVYNHRNFVASAAAQFKEFKYSHSSSHDDVAMPYTAKTNGRLTDWTGSISVGWRF